MAQGQGFKSFGVFFLMILIFLSGVLIFLKGFLLSKSVVNTKSACNPDFAKTVTPPTHKHEIDGCWTHGRFKRAIVIIIDALRYDFLVFNESSSKDVPPYLNKFPSVHYFYSRKPLHSRLYRFRADPPTTTMQRLKGLTTGSLPTFVDVSSNFQSYAITEDNLLHHLHELKKRITFLGDDTWLGLYPKMFQKSFAFPSFDVQDLHTVDNGILNHLYSEIRRRDWDVTIAHFLGVDHCGHRFGPSHPSMAEKLSQMDNVIRSVANLMKNDTILFVMGDHGMTRTGDHGGDSEDELMAGLFIYSPSQLASSPQEKLDNTVSQIDFVPTLSLLLGLPIPFSNLGMVIPELFSHCPWWHTDSNEVKKVFHKVKALRLNALQVKTYLDSYQQISSDLPRRELRSLTESIQRSERDLEMLMSVVASGKGEMDTLHKLNELEKMYITYLIKSRKMCENVWAKFDLKMIFSGISTMACGIALALHFFLSSEEKKNSFTLSLLIICGSILHLIYLIIHALFLPESVPPVMIFVISAVLIFMSFISVKAKMITFFYQILSFDSICIFVTTVFSCLPYFSNSFIIHEDKISLFLLQSLLFCIWLKIARTNHSSKPDSLKFLANRNQRKLRPHYSGIQYLTEPSNVAIVLLLICSMFLRLSSNFTACREEQHGCLDSFFLISLSNLDTSSKNQRYLLSMICLGVIVFITRYWLKYYGNLNGTCRSVICLSYVPSFAAICICLHWAFQALPQTYLDSIPQWQHVVMAQSVYIVVLVSVTTVVIFPLLIHVLPSKQESSMDISKGSIPSLYNQIKLQMDQNNEVKPPLVYGLGSVYSASVIALCSIITLLLCLLLSDGIMPSMLCAVVSFYIALELYSAATLTNLKQTFSEDSGWQDSFWYGFICLSCFSTVFFYATGHQATIPSIRMEAAFIGLNGDFSTFILPGFLVWINTFASHILFALASPLFIFLPHLSSAVVKCMVKVGGKRNHWDIWRGDFCLYNDGIQFQKKLFQFFTGLLLVFGLKMLLAACATTIHRRHLMVWKIFAPRFIYESCMFVTISVCLSFVYLFVLRVDAMLFKFVQTLPSEKVSKD